MHPWTKKVCDPRLMAPARPRVPKDPNDKKDERKVRIRQDLYAKMTDLAYDTRGEVSIVGIVNAAVERYLPTISAEKPSESDPKQKLIAAVSRLSPEDVHRVAGCVRMLHERDRTLSDKYKHLLDSLGGLTKEE
jgi:phosphatidylserine decarboxylase